MVNWNRSLEPTEMKSASAISSSSCHSSEGTSSIAPYCSFLGSGWPNLERCCDFLLQQRARLPEFVDLGDHGDHDRELAARRRLEQRAKLGAQQARPVERQPDGAPAERRVFFLGRLGNRARTLSPPMSRVRNGDGPARRLRR